MKKNVMMKMLALVLAGMLAVAGCGAALAESFVEDANGNVLADGQNVTWNGNAAYAESRTEPGETTTLTVTGVIENNDDQFALNVMTNGGTAEVDAGAIVDNNEEAHSAVHVNTQTDKDDVDVTVGEIKSESDGVRIESNGGDVVVVTEDVDADGTGVFATGFITVKPIETTQTDPTQVQYDHTDEILGYDIYVDASGNQYIIWNGDGQAYQFTETDYEGTTNLQVNGNVTAANENDVNGFAQGVVSQAHSENKTTDVEVVGDVTATGDAIASVIGVQVESYAGEASAEISGDVTATLENAKEDWATANAAAVIANEDGTSKLTVTGDLTAEGNNALGLTLSSGDDYQGFAGGTANAEIQGNITVTGTTGATGLWATVTGEGSATALVEGNIAATSDEHAAGIAAQNYGGEIDITVEGNVTCSDTGISLTDSPNLVPDEDKMGKTVTVVEDEYSDVTEFYDGDGEKLKVYHHEDEDGMYDYLEDGTIINAMTFADHAPGSTRVAITGDVTAEVTGVMIDLTTEKAKMDVIVDGTLSGKTQSVLVSEETISDDLTLTVWEIKENKDGNLVERITEFDEDGEVAATEADKTIEKKIQYIIRIEPTQTGIITTKGTTQYEGYNVAHEGDTVTLKVNVPAGYSLKNAFNGTDTKVQLLQDENGEYYLVVPRGGAVMLSVELEKIPDPDPQPQPQPAAQTTPKADVKAAQDTAATTELKKQIEEAFKKNDFLSILPQEIKDSVQGVTALVEAVTLSLENYDPAMGAVTVTVKTARKFARGESAKVVIVLPNADGSYTYFYVDGEGQADGTLALNLTADTAKALAGKTFVTLILE